MLEKVQLYYGKTTTTGLYVCTQSDAVMLFTRNVKCGTASREME